MTKTVMKGYVFRIKPTLNQINNIEQTFGCVRKIRNELLSDIKEGQKRTIPEIKTENPYTYNRDSQAYTFMWKALMQSIKDFKKGIKGFPKFSRKYDSVQSYTTGADKQDRINANLNILNGKLFLRKIGWVKIKQHRNVPDSGRVKAATIKREAGKYYVSLHVEYRIEVPEHNNTNDWMIGLDYSPNNLYVDQYGNSPEYIKSFQQELKHEEQKVQQISKVLSRKVQGSNNWKKIKLKLQQQQKHIANKRKDFYHKESRRIVNMYYTVVIEDLDLKSMGEKADYDPEQPIDFHETSKAKRRRKSMFRTGYRIFTNMLQYKLEDEGKTLIQVHRYYPSTKTCPMCSHKQDMPIEIRIFRCEQCGHEINRDQNAAYNLVDEGLMIQGRKDTQMNKLKWISL